jgi:hypothetical protein
MEGNAELTPWDFVIFQWCGGVGGPPGSYRGSELLSIIHSLLELCIVEKTEFGFVRMEPIVHL